MNQHDYCISLENINKSFDKKEVLKSINLNVSNGTIFGMLGPSGCGKTTTVKIMAGILEASSGEAYVLGKKMPNLNLMGEIGYMAQSDALYSGMSARENLHFFGALYSLDKKTIQERAAEVMKFVGLLDDMDKQVQAYSGGMKRRLSLAMALLHQPKILILDEPTVGIDPLLRQEIWEELVSLAKDGVTIIVTTHVMDEAERCDQLIMMREGKLIAQGTPEQIQKGIGVSTLEEAFIYYSKEDFALEEGDYRES